MSWCTGSSYSATRPLMSLFRSSSASSGSTAPRARVRPAGFPRGDSSPPPAGSFFSTRFFLAAFFVFFAFFRAAGRLTSTVGDSLSSGDDASAGSSAAPRAPPAPAAPA